MTAQHTPGPWRYDYEDGYCGEIIASNGKTVATFADEPNTPDARLIAAAPELLDALTNAREGIKSMTAWEHPDDTARPWSDCLVQIDAAIAKAGGAA